MTTYKSHVLVVSIELDVDLLVDAGFRLLMVVLTNFVGHFFLSLKKLGRLIGKYCKRELEILLVRALTKLNRRMTGDASKQLYILHPFDVAKQSIARALGFF